MNDVSAYYLYFDMVNLFKTVHGIDTSFGESICKSILISLVLLLRYYDTEEGTSGQSSILVDNKRISNRSAQHSIWVDKKRISNSSAQHHINGATTPKSRIFCT